MALPINTAWDVRPATGNDGNGGAFVSGASGTDYSQQTSPQYALTGLISSGSGNTILSAAAASDMVGNVAQAISGTNIVTGFYEVTSVSVGVSITFSLNNSGGSICSGTLASGVVNIGGSLATVSAAITAKGQGNRIYLKGTYTVTAVQNIVAGDGGTGHHATTIIGYTTTHGDNGKATWTTSTNSVDLVAFAATGNVEFQNILFSNTAGTKGNGITAGTSGADGNIRFINCVFDGFNVGLNGPYVGTYAIIPLLMVNCEVKNCVSHGVWNSFALVMLGCFIHGNGGDGVHFGTSGDGLQSATIAHTVFYSNTGVGIGMVANTFGSNGFVQITNCDFVLNTSHGVDLQAANFAGIYYQNNIFVSNGGYGIHIATDGMHSFLLNNAFYNNTSGMYDTDYVGIGDITLTGTPFNSPSGGDFSLNSTTGAGSACKGAAFPGTFCGGNTVSGLDVGAAQSIPSGGGAAGGSYTYIT